MGNVCSIRAGLYLRISKDRTGDHLGVQRQQEDGEALAGNAGWTITRTYTDNDRSAFKQRPAYEEMLADIRAGHIDAIIAWHPDRLYRRVTDLTELVDVCRAHGTQIATVNAGHIDLSTPSGRLVAGMLAQVATFEVEHKTDRWSRSYRQHREQGRQIRTASRLFGYTPDGAVDPSEAAIVKQIVADVLAGRSLMSIATRLERENVRATRGGTWVPGTLRNFLRNPKITGLSTLNGEVVGEGMWEPVVDRETWNTLQAVLSARRRSPAPRVALLNGLLFCGRPGCGHRMVTSKSAGGARTYRCPQRPGMRGCGRVQIVAEPAEQYVEAWSRRRLSDPRVRALVAAEQGRPAAHRVQITALEQRVAELEAQLDEPGTPVGLLLGAIERAKEKRDRLIETEVGRPRLVLPDQRTPWPTDLAQRRTLVDVVVARVTVAPADPAGPRRFDGARLDVSPV